MNYHPYCIFFTLTCVGICIYIQPKSLYVHKSFIEVSLNERNKIECVLKPLLNFQSKICGFLTSMLCNFLVQTLQHLNFFRIKTLKNCSKSSILYGSVRNFQYCQSAQNQPKFHILFHKFNSPQNLSIMALFTTLLTIKCEVSTTSKANVVESNHLNMHIKGVWKVKF